MEGRLGSAVKPGLCTPTRLLGSYRRMFDSHRPTSDVPMISYVSPLSLPTTVTIPDRLPTVPGSPSEIERATGLEPATFSLGN
jgi:hypothetical protein